MADKFNTGEIRNPKKTIYRREQEAMEDRSLGVNKGDIQGPNIDFFKPRTDKARTPPADMLARHRKR